MGILLEQEDVLYDRNDWEDNLLKAIEEIEEEKIVLIGERYDYFILTKFTE